MTGPEYDAEFEAFLKRRSPMHRRLSDIDHAEPSVELDRLVLTRAREAIDAPSQPPLFRSTRWALPVGLAATILIAFTVVLNVDHHANKGGGSVASSVSPAAEAQAPAVARAASVRESAERAESPRVLSDSAPRDAVTEKKAAAPAVLAKRTGTPESAEVADASANTSQLVASSGAVSSPLRTQQAPGLTASARGGAPLAMAPPPAPAAAAPAAPSADSAADPHASADSWLREINRLRAAGRTAEADRELAAFREAYPTHPAYSVAKPPAR